jgi:hypothetical protein
MARQVQIAQFLTINLAKSGERISRWTSEIGRLYDKHGDARGEHCHRGNRYDDPAQA